jgi:hypothetical protein
MYSSLHEAALDAVADLATDWGIFKFVRQFEICTYTNETDVDCAMRQDPFGAFVYASQQDDIELGKWAVERVIWHLVKQPSLDLWKGMSGAKESWQIALAMLIFPKTPSPDPFIMESADEYASDVSSRFAPK